MHVQSVLCMHIVEVALETLCVAECGMCSSHHTMLGGDKLLPLFFEIGLWLHEASLCLQYHACLHILFKPEFNGMF